MQTPSRHHSDLRIWNERTNTTSPCENPNSHGELQHLQNALETEPFASKVQNITTKASFGASIWNLYGALKTSGIGEFKNFNLMSRFELYLEPGVFEGGTFMKRNMDVEPFKRGTFMWNLGEPQPWNGTWNLLSVERWGTWCQVSGRCPKPPRNFIGRTPSFSSCWGKKKESTRWLKMTQDDSRWQEVGFLSVSGDLELLPWTSDSIRARFLWRNRSEYAYSLFLLEGGAQNRVPVAVLAKGDRAWFARWGSKEQKVFGIYSTYQ